MNNRVIKVLLGKTGLDTEDKGVRLIARGLRDQGGMKVIYTGLYRSIEEIVEMSIQEDVDVIGLSVHNGAHKEIFHRLNELLALKGADNILVIGGGAIPDKHRAELKSSGMAAEVFALGISVKVVIDWINKAMASRGGNI